MGEIMGAVAGWIVAQVQHWGYWGIFAMMTVESSFVPFPSEIALIPAGYLAARGDMSAGMALAAGVGGSLLGAFINYGLALWIGRPFVVWLDRWMPGSASLGVSERYFERHGEITTFVARLIPGIRQLISIPAGLARMNLPRFAFYTGFGAGLWSGVLVGIGYLAGETEETWRPVLENATLVLLVGCVALVGSYVWVHRRASRVA